MVAKNLQLFLKKVHRSEVKIFARTIVTRRLIIQNDTARDVTQMFKRYFKKCNSEKIISTNIV